MSDYLSQLPLELKRMIYKHLLLANDELGAGIFPLVEDKVYRRHFGFKVHLAILRTSRAIHDEAMPILYGENVFVHQSKDSCQQRARTGKKQNGLGRTRCNMLKALETGPTEKFLYWIGHLELQFGDTTSLGEKRRSAGVFVKLAKAPNQLKTVKLELWEGLGTQKMEVNMLRRMEMVKVSVRFTLTVWYIGVGDFEYGHLNEWQASSMSEGAYTVESASVEIDDPNPLRYRECTVNQWVMVPKSG